MPLTGKGEKIKEAMEEQYGKEKGEEVFHASKNKGTITGVDQALPLKTETTDAISGIDAIANATHITHVKLPGSVNLKDAATLNWAGGEHKMTEQENTPKTDYPKDVSGVE